MKHGKYGSGRIAARIVRIDSEIPTKKYQYFWFFGTFVLPIENLSVSSDRELVEFYLEHA
jgi:hypothetical protein